MTIRHIVAAKPSFVPTSPINCVYSMTGKVLYPSPMIMGVPKSANTRMNTSNAPASSDGITSGKMIFVTRWKALQPRLSAASFRELSRFFIAPETYM